jgi:hypothetical protein
MNFFNNALNLMAFLYELPNIAERADRERLTALLPAFQQQFPDIWGELVYCSQMQSPSLVLAYLVERDKRLTFLKSVPNVEPTIQFLMDFIKERSSGDSNNHSGAGNASTIAQRKNARRFRAHS